MAKRSKRKSADNPAEPAASDTQSILLRIALIIATGLWVYAPVLHGDWLWDDDLYVTNNPLLRTSAGLWNFWFHPGAWIEYYPVTETLLWIEWLLFGMDTLGYHLVTLALHIVNALLVWRLLGKLGLIKAWLGGLLFVLHPVNVESVAWIVELKNTLSMTPLLLAMLAYLDFDETRQARDYARSVVLFLVAMLGKTAVLMFPTIILLHAVWKRGRLTRSDWKTSAPFFAISFLLGLLNSIVQHTTDPDPSVHAGWVERLASVGWTIPFSVSKCILPVGLLPIYPGRLIVSPSLVDFLPWLLLAAGLGLLWKWRGNRARPWLLGIGFFVLNLVPVLFFVLKNATTMVWSVDHLLYLPLIGLIGLFVAAIGQIETRLPANARLVVIAPVTSLFALLAIEAHAYAGAFTNEATLWNYTVERNPNSWMAQDNLAKALLLLNRPDEAVPHFQTALQLRPDRAQIHFNLGRAYIALDRIDDGLAEYNRALALSPNDADIYNQKGVALLQANRLPEALAQFQHALALRPDYALALDNQGIALAQSHRLPEAIAAFTAALKIDPDNTSTLDNLASAQLQSGQTAEAAATFQRVLQLDPRNAKAQQALAPGK